MCGICGVVVPSAEELDRAPLRGMCDAIAHRGPDGSGEAESVAGPLRAWLGHRRLSILDLSERGDQPMASADGQILLTYNGEIYNYRDLRRELEARGHRFRSTGDTEVVLRAYEEWAEGAVARLDGMFALAIWDASRQRLLLARDRAGKKPLFYAQRGSHLAFGSELKSVLLAPFVDRRMDESRLAEYLAYGYVPHPATLYDGILELPPASIVTFDAGGLSAPVRYWEPIDARRPVPPSGDWSATIRDLLRSATARRLMSDVPLGALLSGGIDSSVVVGLMSELMDEPVHTFSIGFPEEPTFDERSSAQLVSRHFGTRHTEFAVTLDAVRLLDRLVWFHDQPFQDSSAIPTYVVSGLAREHVTVALNGDGGDEVFGGYDRFKAARIPSVPAPVARLARSATTRLSRGHGYGGGARRRAERFFKLAEAPARDRYQSWIEVFPPEQRERLLGQAAGPVTRSMDERYARASRLPPLDQILFANFSTYLPDDLAVKIDRMSMAHSLEVRSPFLDTALVEFLFAIPARRKVGMRHLKPLLRRAFWPLLPPEIWNRPKHGFGVPMGRWMNGELGTVFEDEVLAHDARSAAVIDPAAVRAMHREHVAGEQDHGAGMWSLLTLERWMRTLDAPQTTAPPRDPLRDAAVSAAEAPA
jgi:asparagine synthase (glutamine-hydrolysing)